MGPYLQLGYKLFGFGLMQQMLAVLILVYVEMPVKFENDWKILRFLTSRFGDQKEN